METNFDPEKDNLSNTKLSVDKILKKTTKVKRARKTAEEKKREQFVSIINRIISLEERSIILNENFDVDLSKYNEPYQDIIDDLFNIMFNPDQLRLIQFFLYDRYAADGTITPLLDENDNMMKLDDASDLYNLLKIVKEF